MICRHMETMGLSSTWKEDCISKSLEYAEDKKQEAGDGYHVHLNSRVLQNDKSERVGSGPI